MFHKERQLLVTCSYRVNATNTGTAPSREPCELRPSSRRFDLMWLGGSASLFSNEILVWRVLEAQNGQPNCSCCYSSSVQKVVSWHIFHCHWEQDVIRHLPRSSTNSVWLATRLATVDTPYLEGSGTASVPKPALRSPHTLQK